MKKSNKNQINFGPTPN